MNDPLPLPFEHGYSEDQLRWHWDMFKQRAPMFGVCVDNKDDAQFSWVMYMIGAYTEAQRGQQGIV